jgi:hypothetical protein
VSRPTCRIFSTTGLVSRTGLSPAMAAVSNAFHYQSDYHIQALPISLATTLGISVDFFSCSYLDVSVRRVRFAYLCIQYAMTYKAGFPHSEIFGSMLVCQLPEAYRRLLRPSSPVIAKASTMCTYSLVPITLTAIGIKHLLLCLMSFCMRSLRNTTLSVRLLVRLIKLYFFQIVKERNSSSL